MSRKRNAGDSYIVVKLSDGLLGAMIAEHTHNPCSGCMGRSRVDRSNWNSTSQHRDRPRGWMPEEKPGFSLQ